MPDRVTIRRLLPGERVTKEMPYSEVCMSMRVAGRVMIAEVLDGRMAQLYDEADAKFSAPITLGEAGIYIDQVSAYVHEDDVRNAIDLLAQTAR
jgi:hypothetical protein